MVALSTTVLLCDVEESGGNFPTVLSFPSGSRRVRMWSLSRSVSVLLAPLCARAACVVRQQSEHLPIQVWFWGTLRAEGEKMVSGLYFICLDFYLIYMVFWSYLICLLFDLHGLELLTVQYFLWLLALFHYLISLSFEFFNF